MLMKGTKSVDVIITCADVSRIFAQLVGKSHANAAIVADVIGITKFL